MEHRHLRGTSLLVGAVLIIAGCGGLGKMNKYAETIKYTVEPNPLIVQGDSVAVNIRGNFPGKYFYKKAQVELTPTITYSGGETPMKMAGFQGEGAAGNYTVIPYESGKDFTYNDKVAYTSSMEQSQLMLNILGKQGKKEKPFDPVKLADGVITTPYLMMSDDKVLLGKDAFQRITQHQQNLTLNYYVASDRMLPGEERDQDVKDLMAWLKANAKNEKVVVKNVSIDAYASPEGEVNMNEGLANKRDEAAKRWMMTQMSRFKYTKAKNDSLYTLNPRGEDWAGFKAAMQASTMSDKDLVLRVLEMYPDVNKREAEIKNMAATYNEIREDILPKLRRSEIMVDYERVGHSDEELTAMSKTMPDSMTVEELLFAATLTNDLNEKLRIYKETERIYPNDYRGANNVGYIYMMQNKMADAETQFTKANGIMDNPVSTNNLGVVARLKGDRKKAAQMYSKAMAAGPEVKYNQGIVDIQNGNYGSANSNMSGMNTFNAALAKLLGGDASGAQRILEAAPEKDSAMGHYLMAIIGARQGNGDMVRNDLGMAVQKDPSLADKARKDLEFRDFKDNLGI
ncbi:MAG: hypothetical protein KDB97_04575 [Flavobacteriales bacterium]|nr:hypothetical protein [Flavobacteriales bacterium]